MSFDQGVSRGRRRHGRGGVKRTFNAEAEANMTSRLEKVGNDRRRLARILPPSSDVKVQEPLTNSPDNAEPRPLHWSHLEKGKQPATFRWFFIVHALLK